MLRLFKSKKPAAIFGIAAGSFESLCLSSGCQHIFFSHRQSALPKKEEAVSKGEVEKCASAKHCGIHYRGQAKNLSRLRRRIFI
jgi:hypothetical protein